MWDSQAGTQEYNMPAYQLSDPVIAAFVVIPIALAATLVWATLTAWRRQPDGSYLETLYTRGTVPVESLPGVTIELESLFI